MKTVWKFQRPVRDEITITGPAPLKVIHVAPEGPADLLIWAEVDDEGDVDQLTRALYVVGTGNPIPYEDHVKHLGSVVAPPFVWHVYDGGLVW